MNKKFHYGDVVVKICEYVDGKPAKFVVNGYAESGFCLLSMISRFNELLSFGREISPRDPKYIKVGRWDFDVNMEVDDEI